MLRLPAFEHHRPKDLDEAVVLLGALHARGEPVKVIAGGTDLVPNMKHEITVPAHVISLRGLGLAGIRRDGDTLVLGAMTTVHAVGDDSLVGEHLPALAEACRQIAGPQLRRMGTLGGNVCLDTRCLYINQTHFWRSALGFCLKKDGTVCHVVQGGQNCVAAASNDSALPLILYGASLHLRRAGGERVVGIDRFFTADGVHNTVLEPDEILTEIRVPVPGPKVACAFEKLRLRKAIDYPLLNVAVRVDRDGPGRLERCDLVVSALGARPKRITLDKQVRGRALDAETIALVGKKAHAACRPLTNLATDPTWRREMIPVLVRRAMGRL